MRTFTRRSPRSLSLLFSASALVAVLLAALGANPVAAKLETLQAEPRHGLVAYFVMDRFFQQAHYEHPEVDDALSAQALDRFIESLDSNRSYFLASDIEEFQQFRHSLDDRALTGDVSPAFTIYERYVQRVDERIAYALEELETEPDLSRDEEYTFDRSEADWAETRDELDELWRKRVKNDLISLLLAEREDEEAVERLKERYSNMQERIHQMDADDVFEVYLNAFAYSIDPHTAYLNPVNSEEYRIEMSASVEGVGATLQTEDDYTTVVDVIAGGPADVSDALHPGDRITAVGQGEDGKMEDVVGWRLQDVVQLIRGPKGSVVRLQVLPAHEAPGGAEKVHEVVRDKVRIEARSAKSEILDVQGPDRKMRVGVIDIPSFYTDFEDRAAGAEDFKSTTRDVRALIEGLQEDGIDALVLDLRDNGGGSLDEAEELTGLFIDDGPVVQIRLTDGRVQVAEDPFPGTVYDGPLTVLVNRFSASASEIFAGAIQDYGRGIVVGQRTYGKGTIQQLADLDRFSRDKDTNFGRIKFTAGKFYRVTGSSTQHRGVIPDVELPSPVDEEKFGESSRDNPLPWDQIEAADSFGDRSLQRDRLARTAEALSVSLADDPELALLKADYQAIRDSQDRETVSLVLAERQARREEQRREELARENRLRAYRGLPALEDPAEMGDADHEDLLLRKTANLAAALASRDPGVFVSQTRPESPPEVAPDDATN